jgi:hypothetical protein
MTTYERVVDTFKEIGVEDKELQKIWEDNFMVDVSVSLSKDGSSIDYVIDKLKQWKELGYKRVFVDSDNSLTLTKNNEDPKLLLYRFLERYIEKREGDLEKIKSYKIQVGKSLQEFGTPEEFIW